MGGAWGRGSTPHVILLNVYALRGGATRVPINVRTDVYTCTNLYYIQGYKERFNELECS